MYVAVPAQVTLETDIIPFPSTLEDLIYEKSLNYVSRKQGDGTNIFSVTDRDINNLLTSIL